MSYNCHPTLLLRALLIGPSLLVSAQVASIPASAPSSAISFASRPNAPARDEWRVQALTQTSEHPWIYLRGKVVMEGYDMLLRADEIDYNEDVGYVEARGNVYFTHFERNEQLWASKVEYDLKDDIGNFYNVRGSTIPRIEARPGVLTSRDPFYFEGAWAERIRDKYILHDGFITNCRLPNPWWVLRGPKFDIVPDNRAIAQHSVFWLKRLPLFYTPFFYKSLERHPRRSGFLTPNLGNSSRRGLMLGVSYYWAINRSYDLTYRLQSFTQRGFAHNVVFRGTPAAGTAFNAIFYGVQDRGLVQDGRRIKQGGLTFSADGTSQLPGGFTGKFDVNYLSSMLFRVAFSESFNEAISSESHSVGFVSKTWSSFSFTAAASRLENFQNLEPDTSVVIRRLPAFDFTSRPRPLFQSVPLWVTFHSTAALVGRSQPLFQTSQFIERLDLYPRIITTLHWKDFHLTPTFAVRQTHYGDRQINGTPVKEAINRHAEELSLDLAFPTLTRTFEGGGWLGDRIKHVIEPRLAFRHVRGIDAFSQYIRFDETELQSNTTELDISLINRIYVKRKGVVSELLSWQLWHSRYFSPSFGGAVINGQRNVTDSTIGMTGYAFMDAPRGYSPIVSVLRLSPVPGVGAEWRSDYDSFRHRFVNSGLTADARLSRYFISIGHTYVRSNPQTLTPSANQMRGLIGLGDVNRPGWNAAFTAIYDFRLGQMQYSTTQVTYNLSCCAFSIQYRRSGYAGLNENQVRVAFAVANIGSFGTLRPQERLF